jgi:hypothetical protein
MPIKAEVNKIYFIDYFSAVSDKIYIFAWAVPLLIQLVASFLPQRSEFDLMSGHIGLW